MAVLLNCEALTKYFGTRLLFSGISLGIFEGERVGMIGPNGSGKSTLLNVLAGDEPADAGEVSARRQVRMSYVRQDDVFPEGATVEEALFAALAGEHLDEREQYVRVSSQLTRMGFSRPAQPVAELSGGWRKRLALARALVTDPELVLLDEPTNHLDMEGILWLEKLLKNAPFAFLLVSHDRYLLENVTTRIIEINRTFPDGYYTNNGNYSDFLIKREEYLSGQLSQQQALESRVRQEIEWLKRGARARTTKAKGRIEDAERMIGELAAVKERTANNQPVQIDFTATGRRTKRLLAAKDLEKSLGGRTLFTDLDLTLSPGTRLGLLGANGSGKTTLLRVLSGALAPDHGEVWTAEGLRIVYFRQSRETLDPAMSLRRALSPNGDNLLFRGLPVHVAGWAKRFLFRQEQLPLPVAELSGGEQARLLIAQLMLEPADVLILDEPTNDLDISSLEVLEESLEDFPGALVLVTHDRYMLDSLCSELLALDGQGKTGFFADFAQWERAAASGVEKGRKGEGEKARGGEGNTPQPKPTTPRKSITWKEERELEGMEAAILAAEARVECLMAAMQDPANYADHREMHRLSEDFHQAQEAVKTLYARWEELEEKSLGAQASSLPR